MTGALFFLGFGAIWMFIGMKGTHHASPFAIVALAAITSGMLATTVWLWRRAHALPVALTSPEENLRAQRMFTAVNIIQWVSVAIAIAILNVLHHPPYIVPAIAIIVGLHLLPLAQSFRYRQHYVTAGLMLVWATGCMCLLPPERIQGICAAGVASVLLGSAASTLLRCAMSLRNVASTTLVNSPHASQAG